MTTITFNIDVDGDKLEQIVNVLTGRTAVTSIADPIGRVLRDTSGPVELTNVADDGKPSTTAPAFDSDGISWDERIHSSSKATTEDGKWRKRRGVADDQFAAVYAELKSQAVPSQPAIALPIPPTPPVPSASSVAPVAAASATIPSVPAPPVIAAAPAAPIDITYGVFIGLLTKARTVHKLEAATIETALTTAGLEGPRGLATHPEQIPGAYAIVEALIAEATK